VIDELGHGRRRLGQAPDDPEPVHVGKRPMERAQLAQVVGLVDDGGKGPADPGWRRGQGEAPGWVVARPPTADLASTGVYIKAR
jgi:hypothetical protein